jgi:hypothetical protein
MTSGVMWVVVAGVACYLIFHLWYGGRSRPLSQAEVDHYLQELAKYATYDDAQAALDEVRQLVAKDDGREFVMQNLARYRPKAAYPAGHQWGDSARQADQRYAKGVLWPLLKNGNFMVFVARRSGQFIEPQGADVWHYVAMVRYRSKRDFLKFALEIEKSGVVIHKWAALEKTHVFPVQPIVSLIMVRWMVASAIALLFGLVGVLIA